MSRTPHRAAPDLRPGGTPQMVEVSRDRRHMYFTNSLYVSWGEIFYPHGMGTWIPASTRTPNPAA